MSPTMMRAHAIPLPLPLGSLMGPACCRAGALSRKSEGLRVPSQQAGRGDPPSAPRPVAGWLFPSTLSVADTSPGGNGGQGTRRASSGFGGLSPGGCGRLCPMRTGCEKGSTGLRT
jgi:hypothetical protein